MKRILLRTGGFAFSTLAVALTSIATVPLLIASIGAESWAVLAAGTAVGTLAAVAVSWGWGVTGPSGVAVRQGAARVGFYRRSVVPRLLLFVPAATFASITAFVIVPGDNLAATLMALATATYAMASPWYFIGIGSPRGLVVYDTVPRCVANLGGAVVAGLTGSAHLFAAIQLVGMIAAVVLTHTSVSRHARPVPRLRSRWAGVRGALFALREQRAAVGASAVASVYLTLPLVVVTAVTPVLAPIFALGDRFLKWSVTATTPLTQVLQGWIPTKDHPAARSKRGVAVAVLFATVISLLVATAGPGLSAVLSKGTIDLGVFGAVAVALAVFATTVTRVTGPSVLIPAGKGAWVLNSAVIGAGIGLILIVPLLSNWGAQGALLSVGLAELGVLITQLLVVRKVWIADGR